MIKNYKNLTLEQMLHLNKEGFVKMYDFLDDPEYIAIVQEKHVYMKSLDKYVYVKTLEKEQNGTRFY